MRSSPLPFWGAFLARLLISAGLVVGLPAGSLGSAYWCVNHKVDEIAEAEIDEAVFDELPLREGKAANFLIVGSDTREFVRTDDDDPAPEPRHAAGDHLDARPRRGLPRVGCR